MTIRPEAIPVRPHRLLDVMTFHGRGYEEFQPDQDYGHSFWSIGNLALADPDLGVRLVVKPDYVCTWCKKLKDGRCQDQISDIDPGSKEEYNNLIDQRILNILESEEGARLTVMDFCQRALKRQRILGKVYLERPFGEYMQRMEYLLLGLNKYTSTRRKTNE